MDIGASALSLHAEDNARGLYEEQKVEQEFREAIVSCRSLSKYESTRIRAYLPEIFASLLAASFHVVVGISLAYSAILIPQLEGPESDLPVTTAESSWIASLMVVAVPVGALIGGFAMDAVGRLNTIKLAALPGCVGWTVIATATDVRMLVAGRLLTGLAAALGTSPAIVYIAEITRPGLRGSLTACGPAFGSLGMMLAYAQGWGLSWRTVAWLGNAYTLAPCALVALVPESPVWLVGRGRGEQALRSLRWLNRCQPRPARGSLAGLHLALLQKERRARDESCGAAGAAAGAATCRARRTLAALARPSGYRPLLVLSGLFLFQQFSGVYVTLFYAVTFFAEAGSDVDPYLAAVLIGGVRLAMSAVTALLLNRCGRRPLVVGSAAGMALCMCASGTCTWAIAGGAAGAAAGPLGWAAVACLLLYVVASMAGMLTVPWTMTAELFPAEIRGVAHSLVFSVANLLMFAAVQSYRDLARALGGAHAVQWFFGGVSLAGALYAHLFLPETHGKRLEDIERAFDPAAADRRRCRQESAAAAAAGQRGRGGDNK